MNSDSVKNTELNANAKKDNVIKNIIALISGLVFGVGLAISGMTDPSKVLGFLDIFGDWDYRLAIVMASALAMTVPAYALTKAKRPWFESDWHLPVLKTIDKPLILGAVLFGAGWGLYGYCPGPAIASLAYGQLESVFFVIAMFGGMYMANRLSGN